MIMSKASPFWLIFTTGISPDYFCLLKLNFDASPMALACTAYQIENNQNFQMAQTFLFMFFDCI